MTGLNLNFGSTPHQTKTQQKQTQVSETSLAKQLQFGSPEAKNVLATGAREGNTLGATPQEQEFLHDLTNASDLEIASKYGRDVALNRSGYLHQFREFENRKSEGRSNSELLNDAGVGIVQGAGNMVLGAAALGASAYDWFSQVPREFLEEKTGIDLNFGNTVAELSEKFSETAESFRSEKNQEQRQQYNLEQELDRQDRQREFEAKGDDSTLAKAKNEIRGAADTIENMINNPSQIFDTVAEGVGSLGVIGKTVQVAARAQILRQMGKEAGEAFLKTEAGKAALTAQATKMVPAVTALTEGGSVGLQARQEILNMSEEELQESPEYRQLIEQGMSPDLAKSRLAEMAGRPAELTGATIGLITGRIAARFEAAPLSTGSVAGAVVNVGKEGVEETLQEAGNQLASNIGVKSAGFERDVLEGTGESAATGLIGGVGTAGAVQAPGAALSTVKTTTDVIGAGASEAAKARLKSVANKRDEKSPVGKQALTSVSKSIRDDATSISLTDQDGVVSDQSTPNELQSKIDQAVFVPDDEQDGYLQYYPDLAKIVEKSGRLDRNSLILALGDSIKNTEASDLERASFAIAALESFDAIKQADSTETQEAVQALPENDVRYKKFQRLVRNVNKLESSPIIDQARTLVEALNPEDVQEMFDFTDIEAGNLETETAKGTIQALQVIGRYNPFAVQPEQYDMVLEHSGGLGDNPALKKSLSVARDIAAEFKAAEDQKAQINEQHAAAIKSSGTENARPKFTRTREEVREDIMVRGNAFNSGLSMVQHRAKFMEAIAAGRLDDAEDSLTELGNFAQSQINKIGAYNTSAKTGETSGVEFEAYGPQGFFTQKNNKPYVNLKSPNSIATALDAHVDTKLVVGLYNALSSGFGDRLPSGATDVLEVPELDQSIRWDGQAITTNDVQPTPEPEQETVSDEAVIEDAVVEPEIDETAEQDYDAALRTEANQTTEPESTPNQTEPENNQTQETDNVTDSETEVEAEPETEVEAVIEDVVEEEPATPTQKLSELLPDLIEGKDGVNYFLEAFHRSENGSKLLEEDNPMETLVREATGLTSEQSKALKTVQTVFLPGLSEDLNRIAREELSRERNTTKNKSGKLTWIEELSSNGQDVLGFKNAMSLNFRRTNEEGQGEFHPKVVDAFVMAAVQWMLNSQLQTVETDDAKINKKLGRPEETVVSDQERAAVNYGPSLQSVLDDISGSALRLMGVQSDKDQPVKFSQGIARSMAANVLEILQQADWVNWTSFEYKIGNNFKTFNSFQPNLDQSDVQTIVEGLKGKEDVFAQTFLEAPEPSYFIGSAPTRIKDTVTRQRFNKLSDEEKRILNKLQNTPNRFVAPMIELRDALGDEAFKKLAGFQEFDPDITNVDHAERIISKNRAIERSLLGIERHRAAAEAYANEAETSYEEVDTFFEWSISSVGRLQQEGFVTPQGDKIAREMISSTNSVLDLTNQEHVDAVWLAAAQALDLKVEKQPHTQTIEEVKSLFSNELKPSVDALTDWFETGEFSDPDEFANTLANFGIDITMKGVHAIMTVARMNYAIENEGSDLTSFETALALEADGKTDGPINAIINAGFGAFTPNQVETMAKGGLIFSGSEMSLNQYIEHDPVDLYEVAANLFNQNLTDEFGSDGALPAVFTVMDALLPDFGLTNEGFDIGRGLIKNPLTVFLYGSGAKGIAGKMSGAIRSEFQTLLSDIAGAISRGEISSWQEHDKFASNPELAGALSQIMGKGIFGVLGNPKEGTINAGMVASLTAAIQETTADALSDAIDEATGGLKEAMQVVQEATQIQAIAFEDAYDKEVKKIVDKKGRKDLLSEKDYEFAFQEASRLAPIYSNGVQEFHIVASEKYSGQSAISASLTDSLSSGATLPKPGEAGVKGQPYLVIGTGDGKMIMNILENGDADLDRTLMVFDGVEIALDKIKPASEQINKAVWKGWQEESVTGLVHEGFEQFLRQFKPETLNKKGQDALAKMAKRRKTDTSSLVNQTRMSLTTLAAQNKARKAAMKRMQASIDHMAGAETPHVNSGVVVSDGIDPEAVSTQLNIFYQEELQKARQELRKKKSTPEVQQPSKALMEFVSSVGNAIEGTGVVSVSGSQIGTGFTEENGFSKDQIKVFKDLLSREKGLSDYTFYFGNADDLNEIREDKFGLSNQKPIEAGALYPNAKVAFIANGSPETVLHEIIHVETVKAIQDFYTRNDEVTEYVQAAMDRLNGLMKLFEDMRFVNNTAQDRAAVALQTELQKYSDNPVHKMSEFLAWTLANQNLIQIGKDTKLHSPLQKITSKVLQVLKQLLGIKSFKGTDFFSNVKFNTEVLIQGSKPENMNLEFAKEEARATAAFEQAYGADPRMAHLEKKFGPRITAALGAVRKKHADRSTHRQNAEVTKAAALMMKQAKKAAEKVEAEGFHMNQREKSAFMSIHASMMAGIDSNPAAQRMAYDLYSHMVRNAKPGSLGVLVGKGGIRKNAENRSDLLSTFVALGLVNRAFQDELSEIDGPKALESDYSSVDQGLRSTANTIINGLTQSAISTKPLSGNLRRQLLGLEDTLAQINIERRSSAERILMRPQEIMDKKLSSLLDAGSKRAVSFIKSKRKDTDGPIKSGAFISAQFVAAMGSKEESENVGEAMVTMLNDTDRFVFLRELVTDLQGVTKTNEPLMDLVNKVKSHIDAMRQDYRERIPVILADKFSRKLKREEWSQLRKGISDTDLTALGRTQSLTLLQDLSKLPTEIVKAEKRVKDLGGRNWPKYLDKSNALAHWMINKSVISNNLLRNAEAIARLLGETVSISDPDPDLVEAIDDLTSLYALERVDQTTKDSLQNLAQTEPDGMLFLIGYQNSTRELEKNRAPAGDDGLVARLNGWKGYAPTVTANGHSLIVRDDSESIELQKLGYERIGTYEGDKNEAYRGSRGYYQSTVGGRSAYRQGVAQSVHDTFNGIDPRTGRTQTGETAGYIYGAKAARVRKNIGKVRDALPADTRLIPLFNDQGDVVGYERTLDPDKTVVLQRDDHAARMLGVWSGRIVEETQSDFFNKQLVRTLKKLHDEGIQAGRGKEFVNVADPELKDQVIKDAWDTMGYKIKEDAAEIFGEDQLWIRKDMVNDALGFHQASVRDAWTGVSRWSPEMQKAIQGAATAILGENAYKKMVQSEELLQDTVSLAKTTIVVRSLVVIWENLLSNNLHLVTWGVGPVELVKQQRNKFIEINQYVKNKERELELTAELAATVGDPRKERRIRAELQVLEDANKTLSIKPLLDAGEFSTVSESLTEQDQALREGKLSEFFEAAADKLPGAVQTGFKNFVITKDTALFQGLNRAVQYGDFVAKAVLYDHLTKEKGYSDKQAMDVIKEEFVNYNRLAGRSRDALEANGLLWFYNYKIRIMKVMTRMLRERPASALMYAGGIGPAADIDTVISGSGLGAYLDGRLGYSIGPEMGINGLFMNPWMNLVD